MKHLLKTAIMTTMLCCLISAAAHAENISLYEAENAAHSGTITAASDSTASGGMTAGIFSDDGDELIFNISVPESGLYDLTFRSKGIGGDKTNNVWVDGSFAGELKSTADRFGEFTISKISLKKGEHKVSITKSWGWTNVDYLKVTESEKISDSIYKVKPELINPNATTETKALFAYLCDSYGKTTLSGQVCDFGFDGAEFKAIHELTGKYPAMLGLDMMNYSLSRDEHGAKGTSVETAIEFHNAGGIVTFCWHWNAPSKYILPDVTGENPKWWGGFYTDNTNINIGAIMNGSDQEGKRLLDADIAEIAKQLHRLEDAGVPVLWRPLHEGNGGWFWWSASGSEAYKKFWIYLYDQLTNKYGCNNLIWIWNCDSADWYPGDEYVDIIGLDIYTEVHQYTAHAAKFSEIIKVPTENKIIAMTENGVVFDVDDMLASNSRWAWFNTWGGEFTSTDGHFSEKYTEKYILKKAYNSEYIITLDELPDIYKEYADKGASDPSDASDITSAVLERYRKMTGDKGGYIALSSLMQAMLTEML